MKTLGCTIRRSRGRAGGAARRRYRVGRRLIPALLAALFLLTAACQSDAPQTDAKAALFKARIQEIFAQVSERVGPELASDQMDNLDHQLADYFHQCTVDNKPLMCGLGVLQNDGTLLAGRYPDPNNSFGATDNNKGQNYSRYKTLEPAFKQGRTVMGPLFFPGERYHAVCGPIKYEGKQVGVLCIAYMDQTVKSDFGLSDEDLGTIDFNR